MAALLLRAAPPRPRADETIKVVGLRRKIAENMAEANRRIQHFTLVEEYDVTELEETRQMMNRDRGSNPKLTLLPFLITAMSRGARRMADAQRDLRRRSDGRHSPRLGPDGRGDADAERADGRHHPRRSVALGLGACVGDRAPVRGRAHRQGEPRGADRRDHSPSRASGPMGGITSTPVVNPPQVAIVAVNKIEEKLVAGRRRDRGPQADEPVAVAAITASSTAGTRRASCRR